MALHHGRATSVETLPNEIMVAILDPFATTELLPLAAVCNRFHLVITRLLYRRLVNVSSLPSNDLILECYHPSAKITTPYLACRHLGTSTRGDEIRKGDHVEASDLKRMYSSFKPVIAEENRRHRLDGEVVDDTATEMISLDEGSLFSQLCAQINLVKVGPRPGLFTSCVPMSEGVIRTWREWLAQEADGRGDGILWLGTDQGVGLRFRVTHGASDRMPVISGPDDYPPITYRLEYQELIVRTRKLLIAAEEAEVQHFSNSGKAIVIASM
ncbi:uncharacterized protein J7T54_006875 [Emericellopsis cladophorae]|uniref:F-box domain-containing protein n=1 Tax=Emericellopsis cladophorae TaxID=2686198 RepID=A0A9P9Y7V8_9HYPO|nr:uncharacterized protein J7T54_006875 [Emericellopsis cladophorae]KAI6785233.1 hypothetical protein J7T54_006875 [Emericellopsis cladophorae]